MLSFDFYGWDLDANGNPCRANTLTADFSAMPVSYVADALARIVRYNGQIDAEPLDVHHVLVAQLVWRLGYASDDLRAALTHDVPEVVSGDVTSPIKQSLPEMRAQLKALEDHILSQWVPGVIQTEIVHLCDRAIRDIERGWTDPGDVGCANAKDILRERHQPSAARYSFDEVYTRLEEDYKNGNLPTWLQMMDRFFFEKVNG